MGGGSWGTILALAYGQAHPDRCLGFVLRGVFLFSAKEAAWFLTGMGRFFPEAERRWLEHPPEAERTDPQAQDSLNYCQADRRLIHSWEGGPHP